MYDEYPEEEAPEATGQELMEIDGSWPSEKEYQHVVQLTFP